MCGARGDGRGYEVKLCQLCVASGVLARKTICTSTGNEVLGSPSAEHPFLCTHLFTTPTFNFCKAAFAFHFPGSLKSRPSPCRMPQYSIVLLQSSQMAVAIHRILLFRCFTLQSKRDAARTAVLPISVLFFFFFTIIYIILTRPQRSETGGVSQPPSVPDNNLSSHLIVDYTQASCKAHSLLPILVLTNTLH